MNERRFEYIYICIYIVRRKEAAWKDMLTAIDEETKERCRETYREEKRKVKRCIIQSKKKVTEQFGRKEGVNGNRKLFWKEVSNAKGGKAESCSRVKGGNGRLAQGEDEARKIWKEYLEDLYNIDTQKEVAVHMYVFDGIRSGNYFRGESFGRADGMEMESP